jgi:hypothetical protein
MTAPIFIKTDDDLIINVREIISVEPDDPSGGVVTGLGSTIHLTDGRALHTTDSAATILDLMLELQRGNRPAHL